MLKSHSPSAGRRRPQTPSEAFWDAHWPSRSLYLRHGEPPLTSPWKLLDAPLSDGVVNWFVSDGKSINVRVLDSKGGNRYESVHGGIARRRMHPAGSKRPSRSATMSSSRSRPTRKRRKSGVRR